MWGEEPQDGLLRPRDLRAVHSPRNEEHLGAAMSATISYPARAPYYKRCSCGAAYTAQGFRALPSYRVVPIAGERYEVAECPACARVRANHFTGKPTKIEQTMHVQLVDPGRD